VTRSFDRTYSGRGIHGEVVHDLAMQIVNGAIPAGAQLDVEEFGTKAGVSRTVVREALKVLEAKGLVQARPRWGTRVRDHADWNMLDPDLLSWLGETEIEEDFLEDLTAVREAVEPAAARLAAEHGDSEDRIRMQDAFDRFERAAASAGLESIVEADVGFHVSILQASGSRFFWQMAPLLAAALRGRDRAGVAGPRKTASLPADAP
jgi:DNA-binding FadR family transcriptional regulator